MRKFQVTFNQSKARKKELLRSTINPWRFFMIVLAVGVLYGCGGGSGGGDKPIVPKGDTLSDIVNDGGQQLIAGQEAVGVTIGISLEGEHHFFNFGEVEKGTSQAPTQNTRYFLASVGKVFTRLALFEGVSRGYFNLDDTLVSFIPAEFSESLTDERVAQITLQQLLDHKSGLVREPVLVDEQSTNPYTELTPADLWMTLIDTTLETSPGQAESYSNFGYGLLGLVIESAYGTSLFNVFEEVIFNLVPMNSAINYNDAVGLPGIEVSPPHFDNGQLQVGDLFEPGPMVGAASSYVSAADMLQFLDGVMYLSDSFNADLIRNAYVIPALGTPSGDDVDWGAFSLNTTIAFAGRTLGYKAYIAIVPNRQFAIVGLANTGSFELDVVIEAVIQAVRSGNLDL